jgi:hypothetical protein
VYWLYKLSGKKPFRGKPVSPTIWNAFSRFRNSRSLPYWFLIMYGFHEIHFTSPFAVAPLGLFSPSCETLAADRTLQGRTLTFPKIPCRVCHSA